MMDNEILQKLERRVTDMETLMQGKIADGIHGGSIIHVMARVVETLYGPKEDPGGLVHKLEVSRLESAAQFEALKLRLDKHDRLIYIGYGIIIAIQVAAWLLSHFHK